MEANRTSYALLNIAQFEKDDTTPINCRTQEKDHLLGFGEDYNPDFLFGYAEVVIDWIYYHKPTQQVVTELWESINQTDLEFRYLCYARNLIMRMEGNYTIPSVEQKEQDCYKYMCFDGFQESVRIKDIVERGAELAIGSESCVMEGCTKKGGHVIVFKLSPGSPCYKLGEGLNENILDGDHHFHHDLLRHFYATEEVDGKRVLLSLVTNSRKDVIDRIRDSKNVHIHYLINRPNTSILQRNMFFEYNKTLRL